MQNQNETAQYSEKQCSIVSVHGCIVVIDHRNNDRLVEVSCGVDAIAHYHFLMNSMKHGGFVAAQEFLTRIADGEKAIAKLIKDSSFDCVKQCNRQ